MKRILPFQLAAFLGAFLLFQVQPMTSKALLPAFGGSYLVWGACMVFYQSVLLAGYGWVHVTGRRTGYHPWARFHWYLMLLPVLCYPFHLDRFPEAAESAMVAWAVFRQLALSVGLPVLALSTVSIMVQRWFDAAHAGEGENPYVLYAASNLGSLAGLLSYPVLVEPFLDLQVQEQVWWGGYALLMVVLRLCVPRAVATAPVGLPASAGRASWGEILRWFLPSAGACALLLAVTNLLTFDVASVPFLWILPLSVYLLSFVLAFQRRPWLPRWLGAAFSWSVLAGVFLHLLSQFRLSLPALPAIGVHLVVLFFGCMMAAALLVKRKPADTAQLSAFYVWIAVGGLAGSFCVSWIIPLVSRSLVEYPLSLVLLAAAVAWDGAATRSPDAAAGRRGAPAAGAAWVVGVVAALILVPWQAARWVSEPSIQRLLLLFGCALPVGLAVRWTAGRPVWLSILLLTVTVAGAWTEGLAMGASRVATLRNFYGIYRIFDVGNIRYLQHGTTQHGREYLSGPMTGIPLAYFHPTTPAGGVLLSGSVTKTRIGMIGLGTGALVAYTVKGQTFTVFEIDPDNVALARQYFGYIGRAEHAGSTVRFETGDGRLRVRKLPPRSLDILILDAFNSGSIPIHLLTVEALAEYAEAVTPGGLMLFHVSNKMLDLEPVIYANARVLGLAACENNNSGHVDPDAEETHWMALSDDPAAVERLTRELGWWVREEPPGGFPRPWTDRYSDVLSAMLRKR